MIAIKRPSVWTRRNLTILLGSTMTVMAGATISPALPAFMGLQAAFTLLGGCRYLSLDNGVVCTTLF